MPKLSGWIEIFRGGKQTDSKGVEHNATVLIDQAIETFDPKFHEPPVVVGHPQDNTPAFGWIEGLKKSGDVLLAKLKGVVPEFADAVKKGLYKKRSASFYPDGRLRHVGFLGAAAPAVKGLADIGFKADDSEVTFEFEETGQTIFSLSRAIQKIKTLIGEVEEIKPAAFADKEKQTEGDTMADVEKEFQAKLNKQTAEFNEKLAGVETKIKEAKEEGRKEAASEFKEATLKSQRDARKKEVSSWCEGMVKNGKLTPALVKFGIPEMLSFMADSDDVIEFGESKEKVTMYDRMKDFFETELPKLVNFGEIAKRSTDVGAGDAAGKLEALIRKKRVDNKSLSYSAAFSEVQAENSDLAMEYQQEMVGK